VSDHQGTPGQSRRTPARAWRSLIGLPASAHGPLPQLLVVMTVTTGLVDAFSYLVLGHVFVANMTGNVVFLAFAIAGAGGFSIAASLLALGAFAIGALSGGGLIARFGDHRARLLAVASTVQAVLVAAALGTSLAVSSVGDGARYGLIALLGLAMGIQNAAVRKLGVPDLTTTVLTLTITGLAADSGMAQGPGSRIGRRGLSVAAMFVGALAGALLVVHGHRSIDLVLTLVTVASVAVLASVRWRSIEAWTKPATP